MPSCASPGACASAGALRFGDRLLAWRAHLEHLDQLAEVVAPRLVVAVGVEAGARRGKQDGLAGLGRGRGGRERLLAGRRNRWSGHARRRRAPRRSARPPDPSGRRRRARSATGSARPAKSSPFSEPPRITWTPPSNERERRDRRRDVRRLRVVHVGDAADLGDALEAVRDARRSVAIPRLDRVGLDPHRERRPPRRSARSAVVRRRHPTRRHGSKRKVRGGDVDLASVAGKLEARRSRGPSGRRSPCRRRPGRRRSRSFAAR